jgi:tetratricopeptide (TPR) repeat protein
MADKLDHPKARLDALTTRGRTLSAMGRHDEATKTFERAYELSEGTVAPSRRREILSAWADSLAALGRHDEAFALMRRALSAR